MRLALRQVKRTKWASGMVATLVALPVAAMVTYAIIAMSMVPTATERVRAELGQMGAWVQPVGVAESGLWQVPATPQVHGYPQQPNGYMEVPDGEQVTDPLAALPSGTEFVKVAEGGIVVTTQVGLATLDAFAGEVWHEAFEGRFALIDGRVPATNSEALVTPATLDRLGTVIGGTITTHEADHTYTIVGTMSAVGSATANPVLFLPEGAPVQGETRWYLPDLSLAWADVQRLNQQGIVAFSRTVVLDPTPLEQTSAEGHYFEYDERLNIYLLLGVSALFAAYVVIMLAGAAFAVSARRQQRSLAIAASVGVEPRDLRRIILMQGTILGGLGGVVGLLVGITAAAVIMRISDDGSETLFWGFHAPWLILLGILVFAVLVGNASATLPATTIARTDVLGALRGSRRPQVPRTSRPVWGSMILLIGIAITVVAGFGAAAVNEMPYEVLAWNSPVRVLLPLGIVIGPIIAQIGMLLSGHWLLWLTARALSRMGLAARIAARDAAANASRTVPAFAAIGVTVFIAVFALSLTSMEQENIKRNWYSQAPEGSLAIHLYATTEHPMTEENASQSAIEAREIAAVAGATGVATRSQQDSLYSYAPSNDHSDTLWVMAVMPERHLVDMETQDSFNTHQDRQNPISVIATDEIETALGITLTPSQLNDYRDGAALVMDERWVTDGAIDVSTWSLAEAFNGSIPDNIWTQHEFVTWTEPSSTVNMQAITVPLPNQTTAIAIAPETAEQLGMTVKPVTVFAAFDDTPTTEQLDRIRAQADWAGSPQVRLEPVYEQGPTVSSFWMVPVLVAVTVLVVGASAVALGLARFERRPDDATLAAVGATRGLRCRVNFWQGLIIAGFGMFMGALTGILPPLGLAIQPGATLQIADIPWVTIGALVIGLPLFIAVVAWLVPPRTPELTRRTAIA